jgi:hypothetical protein
VSSVDSDRGVAATVKKQAVNGTGMSEALAA